MDVHCSFPGSTNSQFRYSYCLHVCACRRVCVFQKLYTDLKTIVFHFCFSHGFNNSNQLLYGTRSFSPTWCRINACVRTSTFGSRGYHWSPMVAWWPLVPIGTIFFNGSVAWWTLVPIGIIYFNGSVAIGHHWYK